jgi:DNA invertase Pin-like site-specific DNA recombinase
MPRRHSPPVRHIIMAWSVDRLGRSLQDLVAFLSEIDASHVELYLHQQDLDTTTPAGRAMFQMMGEFAEFELDDHGPVRSGMARTRERCTKSGKASAVSEFLRRFGPRFT